jgi:hypothetical protein
MIIGEGTLVLFIPLGHVYCDRGKIHVIMLGIGQPT